MRINRIFEGSTEIMHLLIAREAVDRHLEVAGEILEGDGDLKEKARVALQAGRFYAKWLPQLAVGEGQKPGAYDEYGELAGAPALRRAQLAQARALDVLRDGPLAGQAREAPGGARPDRRHRRRAVRDRPPPSSTRRRSARSARSAPTRPPSWPTCSASRRERRVGDLFRALWSNDDVDNYALAQRVLEGRYTFLEEGIADPAGDGPAIGALAGRAAAAATMRARAPRPGPVAASSAASSCARL